MKKEVLNLDLNILDLC